MHRLKDIFVELKRAAKSEQSDVLTHCQMLNEISVRLGFSSYHHLKTSLEAIPRDNFGKVSNELIRKLSGMKLPTIDSPYFEFWCLPDNSIYYYSYFIGWDKFGRDVRVPGPTVGRSTIERLRTDLKHPIYVIESEKELISWRADWKGTALITEVLARQFFAFSFNKKHLVDEKPNMELVRANRGLRSGNYVSDT